LDAYKVDNLYSGSKVKFHTKVGFKLMNLDVENNFMLVEVGINLVVLI
jgi:hypothetical protein